MAGSKENKKDYSQKIKWRDDIAATSIRMTWMRVPKDRTWKDHEGYTLFSTNWHGSPFHITYSRDQNIFSITPHAFNSASVHAHHAYSCATHIYNDMQGLFLRVGKCDAIKQNESDLEKNKNSVFIFIVCLHFRTISH